jgi:formate dehydrogenase beta subunit
MFIMKEMTMDAPAINTWTGGERFADVIGQVVGKRFPDKPPRALVGWNGIMIWDRDVDAVDMMRAYLKRVEAESCGKCTPCREGTSQLSRIIDDICQGRGRQEDLDQIRLLSNIIGVTSRCDVGRTMAKPVLDLLDGFKEEFDDVINGKRTVREGNYHSVVTAPCINACPSHVDVPAYLENVRMDHWPEAMAVVRNNCPMPGTIGRVCVRPCEDQCRRKDLDSPIAIRAVKRFLADQEQFNGLKAQEPETDRKPEKIAVIGAGPAGLSCAYYLGRAGYSATVFECQEAPGGMAAFGIPSYRLPRDVIAHEVDAVKSMGAEIRYGVNVGKDITLDDIAAQGYRAVFLALGAPESSQMRCRGENEGYRGFITGVDFLARAARGEKPLEGRKIVVIGGGNVAMDCVRTARRLGFGDVNLLYRRTETEMPADKHEIREAREEGVNFHFLVAPIEIMAENGKVTGIRCSRMELGKPDSSGRRSPVVVEGSEYVIDCDAVIPAVGQKCAVDSVFPEKEFLTSWNTLVVDQNTFQSGRKEVFGGGDCVTGPATLIAALAAGKNAARFIAQYLETDRCGANTSDMLENLIYAGKVFKEDEPFAFPGMTHRMEPEVLEPDVRISDFTEVEKGFTAVQAREEAARCLRCYRVLLSAV